MVCDLIDGVHKLLWLAGSIPICRLRASEGDGGWVLEVIDGVVVEREWSVKIELPMTEPERAGKAPSKSLF